MKKKKAKIKQLEGNTGCMNCPLHEKTGKVCIMGRGPIPAKIMVVLDAPSLADSENGMPISGANLIYLQDLFNQAGIPWEECYVTTSVKCGVPKGYKIKAKEIKACGEYLSHEMDVVKPRYILTMGATSLQAMVGKGKITDLHGSTLTHESGAKLMPVYSPGVVWRDPSKLDDMLVDLKRFSKLIDGKAVGELPKMNYEVVEDFDRFNRMITEIEDENIISWDIETTGLDRFNDEITVMGFGLKSKQWILPMSLSKFDKETLKLMMEIIGEKIGRKKYVTHNGKFDNLFTRTQFGVRFNNFFDTMIASYACDENSPNGLKYLAKRIFGIPDYDVGLNTKKGGGSKEDLYLYLAYDVYYTRKLYFHFKKELAKDAPTERLFKELLMPTFHMYENVQMEGVYINQERFNDVDETISERIAEIDEKLDVVRKADGYGEINWGSTKQLADYLFVHNKLPILQKTPTGNPSTAGDILNKMKDQHPCIPLLLERKELKQLHSFFINGWKDKLHNGKLYPNFNIHVTVTGRTSSNGPNLQQVPRDKRIRTLVGAPPGWTLVEIDYSQAELRVVTHHSKDPKMVLVYANNFDIHTNTAMSISGKKEEDITKNDRKMAKPVNFGFVYGMGAFKFVDYADSNYGVTMTQQEATEYRRRFFEEYAYLPEWHEKQRRIVRAQKQVRNLIGRLRRLPDIDSPDKSVRSEAERQAINSPIQSFASDLMLMSLVEIDNTLPKEDTRIIGSVHDAGLYIIRNDKLNERIPQIKSIMENPKMLTEVFGVSLDVPIVADVSIGNWGNGIEWNGEHIEVLEDGTVELTVKKKKRKKRKKKRF